MMSQACGWPDRRHAARAPISSISCGPLPSSSSTSSPSALSTLVGCWPPPPSAFDWPSLASLTFGAPPLSPLARPGGGRPALAAAGVGRPPPLPLSGGLAERRRSPRPGEHKGRGRRGLCGELGSFGRSPGGRSSGGPRRGWVGQECGGGRRDRPPRDRPPTASAARKLPRPLSSVCVFVRGGIGGGLKWPRLKEAKAAAFSALCLTLRGGGWSFLTRVGRAGRRQSFGWEAPP